jgi:hypothetical protein
MKSGMRCRRLYQLSKSGLIAVLRSLNGGVAYQYSSMRSPAYLAVCYLALPSGDHRCLFDFYRRKSSPYCYILPAARQRMASTMMATASGDHSAVQELSSALFGELSLGGDDQGEIDWERTAGLAQRCADSLRTGACAARDTERQMLRAMHGMAWHRRTSSNGMGARPAHPGVRAAPRDWDIERTRAIHSAVHDPMLSGHWKHSAGPPYVCGGRGHH